MLFSSDYICLAPVSLMLSQERRRQILRARRQEDMAAQHATHGSSRHAVNHIHSHQQQQQQHRHGLWSAFGGSAAGPGPGPGPYRSPHSAVSVSHLESIPEEPSIGASSSRASSPSLMLPLSQPAAVVPLYGGGGGGGDSGSLLPASYRHVAHGGGEAAGAAGGGGGGAERERDCGERGGSCLPLTWGKPCGVASLGHYRMMGRGPVVFRNGYGQAFA